MKRGRVFAFFFVVLLSLSFVSANVDDEFQKLTHYAEEYETGNINYVQLSVYMASVRESLNEELGATGREMGGVVKEEKLREILGEPNEETKWVWVEGEDHDTRLDDYVPVWRKIVFDGKKIQIRLEVYPSIYKKRKFDEFHAENSDIEDGSLIYRLHFNIEFKKPKEQLDIQGKISEIKALAQEFNSNPTQANAENLAEQSVNAEMVFRNYFEQNQGKCEDLMKSIFGSENKRQSQELLQYEIIFYEAERFDAVMKLEFCDKCEWNYINLEMWIHGPGDFNDDKGRDDYSMSGYRGLNEESFKAETKKILEQIRLSLESGDSSQAMAYASRLRMLNRAWDDSSNSVWEEVEKEFEYDYDSLTDEEKYEFDQNYGWIKRDQQMRKRVEEERLLRYEKRKSFYLDLFSDYDKREFYISQTDFEKRLIEEFKERGRETCDNNVDDNDNGEVDCDEDQCGGKICGRETLVIGEGNDSTEKKIDLYCIQKTCQAKEEIDEQEGPICGNHICEEGEAGTGGCPEGSEDVCYALPEQIGTCPEDCVTCPEYPPIECSGKVIFSGEDEKGCKLEPICIEDSIFCKSNDDCEQPLCGVAECVFEDDADTGKCEITDLKLCGEEECVDGEEKIKKCESGEELVSAICKGGIWSELDTECEIGEGEEIEDDEEIIGDDCVTKSDCGGEDDVCSNGKCVTLPESIKTEQEVEEPEEEPEQQEETEEPEESEEEEVVEEPEEEPEQQEETEEPEESEEEEVVEEPEETPLTGNFVFQFFQTIANNIRITGAITGFATEGEEVIDTGPEPDSGDEESGDGDPDTDSDPEDQGDGDDDNPPEGDNGDSNDGGDYGGDDPGPGPEPDNDCRDKWKACGDPCPPCDYENNDGDDYDDRGDYDRGDYDDKNWEDDNWEEREKEEREKHESEQRERCEKDCIRPCVEKCVREKCGEELDCNIDDETKECESSCDPEEGNCVEKCMEGGDWWQEFEDEEMHREEKGVFTAGGGCRTQQGRTEGYVWFGGWGDPFNQLEPLKERYYQGGNSDWCEHDLESLVKQREELEAGLNQRFAVWFFEEYLANSAEDWEQAVSGIYELYWNSVDNQMQMAHRMKCLGKDNIGDVMDYKLINYSYNTEYGSVEYWEEIQLVNMLEFQGEVTLISPYMKIWIFPNKEFMKYELKKAMEDQEFPGSPEEKLERGNEEGLTEQEKNMLRQDKDLMEDITKVSEKYNGNFDIVIQFKDYEKDEVVFNLYAQVNENDLMKIIPMLPKDVPSEDARVELDYDKLYDIIYTSEKEMRGIQVESPPWDERDLGPGMVKEVTNGVKMYFKFRSLMRSAEVSPDSAKKDAEPFFETFFMMMGSGGPEEGDMEDMEKDGDMERSEEDKGELFEKKGMTGGIILK